MVSIIFQQTQLRELSVHLVSQQEFGEQFRKLRSLEKVKLDNCKVDVLNNIFKYFPSSLKEFHLTACKKFVAVDPWLLKPFPNLTHSKVQLISALELLCTLQNRAMDGMYFRGLTVGMNTSRILPTITLTPKDMKYFNNICVRTFDTTILAWMVGLNNCLRFWYN